MGSPTVKCGRRIESPPSNSFSIIRGVPRAIDVVYCRGVTGCLRLHYSCFWECPKTRACWGKFLRHWAGSTSCVFSRYFGNCTDRQAPEILVLQWSRLLERFQDDVAAGEQVWRRIWFLMCSICITRLWSKLNGAIFRGAQSTTSASVSGVSNHYLEQLCHVSPPRPSEAISDYAQG
uniref:RxLR effector candidate protein n=1 Tax=Hyaloperonospora arabidopsidis (strain Emoy2) TaxID=559515 RepID=M4BJM1_HYAAE